MEEKINSTLFLNAIPIDAVTTHLTPFLTLQDMITLKKVCHQYNTLFDIDCKNKHITSAGISCSSLICQTINSDIAMYKKALSLFAKSDKTMFFHLWNRENKSIIRHIERSFSTNITDIDNNDILQIYLGRYIPQREKYQIQLQYLQDTLAKKDISAAKVLNSTIPFSLFTKYKEYTKNYTLIEKICLLKDLSLFKILISQNKKYINSCNAQGIPTVSIVACLGTKEMLEELFNYPINIESKTKEGQTPLHFAIRGGTAANVKLLCEKKAFIMARDACGNNTLHVAARNGRFNILKTLIKFIRKKDEITSIDIIHDRNNGKMTLLHCAAIRGAIKCMQFLLQNKSDINARDIHEKTPLHYTVERNKALATVLLLDNGARRDIKDNKGNLAIPL